MGKSIAEKVLSVHSGLDCHAGDIVVASVDFAMAQDGTSTMMIRELEELDFQTPRTRRGMAFVIDHNSPCPSVDVAEIHSRIRAFAGAKEIPLLDVGDGICHQVIPESGKVFPGDLVVGADSHTCTYGALNACSTGLGSADVAAAAFTGKLWFRVPGSYAVRVSGVFPDFVGAKDLILSVIGRLTAEGATYKSVEFSGEAIDNMNMDSRMTVANMSVEMGAKFCPFPFDKRTAAWFSTLGVSVGAGILSDSDAQYEKEYESDVSDLVPKISKPHRVDNVSDVSDLRGTEIQQVLIGTCTNGRLNDLQSAARILKGKHVKKGLRLIIAPASRRVLIEALDRGIATSLLKSGAVLITPGCGPCVGTHAGIPSEGDNVLSTANRNFIGRMGNNKNVNIYLASPETAAATAITGAITDPREIGGGA